MQEGMAVLPNQLKLFGGRDLVDGTGMWCDGCTNQR